MVFEQIKLPTCTFGIAEKTPKRKHPPPLLVQFNAYSLNPDKSYIH